MNNFSTEDKIFRIKMILGKDTFEEWVNFMLSAIEKIYSDQQPTQNPSCENFTETTACFKTVSCLDGFHIHWTEEQAKLCCVCHDHSMCD